MWGFVAVVSMSPGRFFVGCDTDPSRRIPLLNPLKKSPFSSAGVVASSSPAGSGVMVEEENGAKENFDSKDALFRNVLSAMIITSHARSGFL